MKGDASYSEGREGEIFKGCSSFNTETILSACHNMWPTAPSKKKNAQARTQARMLKDLSDVCNWASTV